MGQIYQHRWCRHWIKRAAQNTAVAATLLLFSSGTSLGENFTLDWQDDEAAKAGISRVNSGGFSEISHYSCDMSYIADRDCGFGDRDLAASHRDGSGFFQEELLDSSDGQRYFHVIIGDYTVDEMVQEYFIKANVSNDFWAGGWSGSGNIGASHSLGPAGNGTSAIDQPYSADSNTAGTGSGNPNSIMMRQLVTDKSASGVGFSMDFLKDRFAYKPRLTHTNGNSTEGFATTTVIDMSNSLYTDMTPIDPTADFDNTFVFTTDPLKHETAGDYDVDTMDQNRTFTAGGYTYTPGTGTGGSGGTYSYIDPNDDANPAFDPINRDWSEYCDATQNVDWSGQGACKNGDGTGGGGGWGGFGGGNGWGGW